MTARPDHIAESGSPKPFDDTSQIAYATNRTWPQSMIPAKILSFNMTFLHARYPIFISVCSSSGGGGAELLDEQVGPM